MDRVHIGTMGWSYGFWIENFYPRGLKSSEFLTEYSRHFDTVEVDNTFYRIPSKDTFAKWKEQTPEAFVFSVKFPQIITHRKMLKDCERELELFIERVSTLQHKLGPLLLQFPPAFGPEKITLLRDFLSTLSSKYRYAVEIRNTKLMGMKLYSLLRENGAALVVRPHIPVTEQVTADFAYIRWEGDRNRVKGTLGKVEVERTAEIRTWAQKINKLLDETKEVFGYFSKYYSGHPPTDVNRLVESLDLVN